MGGACLALAAVILYCWPDETRLAWDASNSDLGIVSGATYVGVRVGVGVGEGVGVGVAVILMLLELANAA